MFIIFHVRVCCLKVYLCSAVVHNLSHLCVLSEDVLMQCRCSESFTFVYAVWRCTYAVQMFRIFHVRVCCLKMYLCSADVQNLSRSCVLSEDVWMQFRCSVSFTFASWWYRSGGGEGEGLLTSWAVISIWMWTMLHGVNMEINKYHISCTNLAHLQYFYMIVCVLMSFYLYA